MPYANIQELPSQVRASLDTQDAAVWMDTYNKKYEELIHDNDPATATKLAQKEAWMSAKDLPSSFSVESWASVDAIDLDGEKVDIGSIINHIDTYIDYGGSMSDQHSNLPQGYVWAWEERKHPETGTDGIVVYYNVFGGTKEFNQARQDWVNGKSNLSVGASATMDGYQCDKDGCFVRRGVNDLYEIALCSTPANPYAKHIDAHKGRLVKGKIGQTSHFADEQVLRMKISYSKVHKSYNECTLQDICKELRKITSPKNIWIDDFHVLMKVDEPHQMDAMRQMDKLGMIYSYCLKNDAFIVKSAKDTFIKELKEGLIKGYITKQGYLIPGKTDKETFSRLYDYDMVYKMPDGYIMKEPGVMSITDSGSYHANYGGGKSPQIPYKEILQFRKNPVKKDVNLPTVYLEGIGTLEFTDPYGQGEHKAKAFTNINSMKVGITVNLSPEGADRFYVSVMYHEGGSSYSNRTMDTGEMSTSQIQAFVSERWDKFIQKVNAQFGTEAEYDEFLKWVDSNFSEDYDSNVDFTYECRGGSFMVGEHEGDTVGLRFMRRGSYGMEDYKSVRVPISQARDKIQEICRLMVS